MKNVIVGVNLVGIWCGIEKVMVVVVEGLKKMSYDVKIKDDIV